MERAALDKLTAELLEFMEKEPALFDELLKEQIRKRRAASNIEKIAEMQRIPDMRTAREKAISAVAKIAEKLPDERFMRAFENLIGSQQNRPPEGEADGTIDEKQWILLNKILTLLGQLKIIVKMFEEDR